MVENNIAEVLDRLGIPLGERGSPLSPVFDALEKKGLYWNRHTVSGLRKGDLSGRIVRDRAEVFEVTNPDLKNTILLAVAETIVGVRKPQSHPDKPKRHQRWQSSGLTESAAETLGLSVKQIRRLLIVVRSDFASVAQPGTGIFKTFFEDIGDYCDHYCTEGKDTSPLAEEVRAWMRSTPDPSVPNFYKVVYPEGRRRPGPSIGALLSYEVSAFKKLYAQNPPLTPLDKIILDLYSHTTYMPEMMAAAMIEIRDKTGIPADRGMTRLHGNLLAYGASTMHGAPLIATLESHGRCMS